MIGTTGCKSSKEKATAGISRREFAKVPGTPETALPGVGNYMHILLAMEELKLVLSGLSVRTVSTGKMRAWDYRSSVGTKNLPKLYSHCVEHSVAPKKRREGHYNTTSRMQANPQQM